MKYITILLCSAFLLGCNSKQTEAPANATRTPADLEATFGKLYQFYHASPKSQAQKDENIIIEYATTKGLDVSRTNSGLYYLITDEGAGPKVKKGDNLVANYKGYFTDGKEFDSSYKRNRPMEFRHGQMVAGWNEGLLLMNKGGKAQFLIPSHLGYGGRGFPGAVPPNKVIIFDLELLNK